MIGKTCLGFRVFADARDSKFPNVSASSAFKMRCILVSL